MKTSYILITTLLFVVSCQQIKQSEAAKMGSTANSVLFEKHFNDSEVQKIKTVISYFEKGMCSDMNSDDISRCYELHAHGLRSDFLNKIPTQTNYPYNTQDGLHQLKYDDNLANVWSDECKFINSENGKEINYFCYNLHGTYMDYLKKLGENNDMIHNYTTTINNDKGLGNEQIHSVMMSSPEKLDFKNVDHRIFYTLHYLTQRDQNLKNKMLASL